MNNTVTYSILTLGRITKVFNLENVLILKNTRTIIYT